MVPYGEVRNDGNNKKKFILEKWSFKEQLLPGHLVELDLLICNEYNTPDTRRNSHIKGWGMLVVSLRGVNIGF